jgi:NitT/TauT family transport system substrate-binding protein
VGKTVGTPAADTQRVMFPAFAAIIGIDPAQVKFVNIEPAAKTAALATRKVDAIFDLYTGIPFHRKAIPADQLVSLLWADYGFQAYSNCIITTNKMIEENPELIKRFLKASLRGWEWTLRNPEEAIKIMAEYHPLNVKDYLANLRLVMDFFRSDDYKKNGIGHIDPEAMAATVGLVDKYMGVDVNFSVDEMYTNDFLPKPKIELPDF